MKAFVIVDINITDQAGFDDYRSVVGETIGKFGGKVVVVTGGGSKSKINIIEGDWNPKHLVIIEFSSFDQANNWYNSSEYSKISSLRKKSSDSNFIIVEHL